MIAVMVGMSLECHEDAVFVLLMGNHSAQFIGKPHQCG